MLRLFKNCMGVYVALLLVMITSVAVLFFESEETKKQVLEISRKAPELSRTHELFERAHLELRSKLNETRRRLVAERLLLSLVEEHAKRFNLRILGMPSTHQENTRAKVEALINDTLRFPLPSRLIDHVIRDEDSSRTPKPIVVGFVRASDRRELLQRRKFLPQHLDLVEDLSEVEEMMRERAERARREGGSVRWKGKKLFVDDRELLPRDVIDAVDLDAFY